MKVGAKILRNFIYILTGFLLGIFAFIEFSNKYLVENERKQNRMYNMMIKWFQQKQKGKKISDYMAEKNHRNIAIYGMHYIGKILYNELNNSSIDVAYAIDRNSFSISSEIRVINPDDNMEKVDAIIVTAISDYDNIRKILESKIDCPIISLEKLIEEWERSE